MSVVDLGATILAVGELHMGGRTPPLRLKVERRRGSDLTFIAVDPGALIWTVGEVAPRSRTPPPRLKIGRQGGSDFCCAPSIWVRKSGPPGPAYCLSWAHIARNFGQVGFNPFFVFYPYARNIANSSKEEFTIHYHGVRTVCVNPQFE
jgi:hypothetical protein